MESKNESGAFNRTQLRHPRGVDQLGGGMARLPGASSGVGAASSAS